MDLILKLILHIFLIGSVVASVVQKRHDDACTLLCHDIQEINEATETKLGEIETEIAKLRTECISAFNKDVDARLQVIKKELAEMRAGCFCSKPTPDCPEGWSLFQGICYSFQTEKLNWDAALKRCQELGGTLAAADSDENNSFLINLANQMGPGGTVRGPWIGGKRIGGSWVWMKTGESVVYEDWLAGQPDSDAENCIHYYGYDRMQWNNQHCRSEHEFVCEKPTSFYW